MEVIGGKVFAAGNFTNLGGQGGLVTLDAVTGALVEPQYDPGRPIFDLDTRGGTLYAVGGGPGGRLFAYGPDDDTPLWKVKVDGDAVGVAVSATTVYVAGHYDYIVSKDSSCYQFCPGGPHRQHLSAFDAADGKLLAWTPAADTSTGPFTRGRRRQRPLRRRRVLQDQRQVAARIRRLPRHALTASVTFE